MPAQLPISDVLPALFSALLNHSRVVLQAPPGAGKSTYLPLQLLQHKDFSGKRIVMLEPRRLAARSIAEFLASQLGESVGDSVGLRMKQMTKVSSRTCLEVVTEGVLTRMIQSDPELAGVDILIFDEFHERSLAADLALALSLEVQAGLRDDLRLLIMSATLDQQQLAEQLDAKVISSEGRSFPVAMHYVPPTVQRHQHGQSEWQRYWAHLNQTIIDVVENYEGSLLVFLPGQGEILRTQQALRQQPLSDKFGTVSVVPLYGRLTKEEQWQAIAPAKSGERKIVLTTNIAETSLTIEGIQLVIDTGLCRRAVFLPKSGVTQLQTIGVSKASSIQRAGRAGRLGPGHCFRLEEEVRYQRRDAFEPAEIEISDLTELCLDVLLWGSTVEEMPWIQAPPQTAVNTAMCHLRLLGIIDKQHNLTRSGRLIGELGLSLRSGCLIVNSLLAIEDERIDSSIIPQLPLIAAWIDEDPIFKRDDNSSAIMANLQTFKNSPQHKQSIRWWSNKLRDVLQKLGLSQFLNLLQAQQTNITFDATCLLAFAFPERIGFRRANQPKGRFNLAHGGTATIESEQWVDSAEQQRLLNDGKCLLIAAQLFVREHSEITAAAAIEESELKKLVPWLFETQEFVGWNSDGSTLIAETQELLGNAIYQSRPLNHELTQAQQQQALAELLRKKGLSVLNWTEQDEQLKLRLALAHELYANDGFPAVDDDALLASIETWCLPMVTISGKQLPSVKHLKAVNVGNALLTLLDYGLQQILNDAFPIVFQAPSGRKFPIIYRNNAKPKLSVQLQELFGVQGVISVAKGKIPVVAELLSPARRPIQITEDIGTFWQSSYPEVAKEMRGKYPKHRWPDDPINEKPGRSTKGRQK